MTSEQELRPSIEAIATEISHLLWDRQVERRFEGIVQGNPDLLAAAQQNNPFLTGVRRWWATSAALVVRRHIDGDGPNTLRGVVEALVELENPADPSAAQIFRADLDSLEMLGTRFAPLLNSLLHGTPATAPMTFNDLYEAIDSLEAIAQRAYARITNVSRRLDPVAQFDWHQIFHSPWIATDSDPAYELGTDGVPYDAQFLRKAEADRLAHIGLQIRSQRDGSAEVTITNDGNSPALDVRVFLPYAATLFDIDELSVGASANAMLPPALTDLAAGQAVLEFADVHDHTYRQYADIVASTSRVRKLSPIAYRVAGRIVNPRSAIATQ